jgi:hypothetical protein
MKNIHVLSTPKPSRLCINGRNQMHIYITNDEKPKAGDWCLDKFNQIWKLEDKKLIAFDSKGIKRFSTDNILGHECRKIILTTDAQLIKDGIQPIDDDFLEWFVKNPSCDFVEVERLEDGQYVDRFADGSVVEGIYENYKIIIPKEEPKLTLEFQEVIDFNDKIYNQETLEEASKRAVKSGLFKDKTLFIAGAKWQQERSYSEEEVYNLLYKLLPDKQELDDWFEQFKKK